MYVCMYVYMCVCEILATYMSITQLGIHPRVKRDESQFFIIFMTQLKLLYCFDNILFVVCLLK